MTLTIYGVQTKYDRKLKKTDSELRKIEVELYEGEDWKAPLGFNVAVVRVSK